MKLNQCRKQQQGFTFIEIMVSLVILSIGIMALTELQYTVTKGNGSSSALAAASTVADQKMESLKSVSYSAITSEAPTTVTSAGMTFTRQVIVSNNQPAVNVKTVQVIVTGIDGKTSFQVPLTTIIAQ